MCGKTRIVGVREGGGFTFLMSSKRHDCQLLARAAVAGRMEPGELKARLEQLLFLEARAKWLFYFCERMTRAFPLDRKIPPSWKEAHEWIQNDKGFQRAWREGKVQVQLEILPEVMRAGPGAPQKWRVPPVTTSGELAKLLSLHPDDLGWLTAYGQTDHYLYRWVPKRSGGARLIEIPKPMLKRAQRAILTRILAHIPVHEAAHGFISGRSVRSYVAGHSGQPLVLKLDLQDFFNSIPDLRVLGVFRAAGYPHEVTRLLTRICTHATPVSVLAAHPGGWGNLPWPARNRLLLAHLPQGSPVSPMLSNLCAFKLDCRLSGLARAAGGTYSRYADDLLFSGGHDFARQAENLHVQALAIIHEEGFLFNARKTRFMRASQRQGAAGAIINAHPNISREEFDRLKAILTNCQRHGPESQNRAQHEDFRGYLMGKIAWTTSLNPARGAKLREIFERIAW